MAQFTEPFELTSEQNAAISELVWNDCRGLNVSDRGAGKTIVAVKAARLAGKQSILVLGPKSTRESWQSTVEAWYPDMPFFEINTKKAGKLAFASAITGQRGFYFCGQELARKRDWSHNKLDLVIVDEIHRMATTSAKSGMSAIKTLGPVPRMGLSGTLARNRVENLWAVCSAIWPGMEYWGQDDDYYVVTGHAPNERPVISTQKKHWSDLNPKYKWQFFEMYLNMKKDFFAGWVPTGETAPGYILRRAPCVVDVPVPPLKSVSTQVFLDMTAKQKKMYKQMLDERFTFIGSHPTVASIPLTSQLRSRQITLGEPLVTTEQTDDGPKDHLYFDGTCKSPIADWVVDEAKNGTLGDQSFVVYTHSRSFSDMLAARLNQAKVSAFAWNGGVKQDVRDQAKQDFMDGKLQVIVAQIDAIGTGTDGLQRVCHIAVWASESLDSTTNEQAAGRLLRRGQERTVSNIHLYMRDTEEAGRHDERVEKMLQLRKSTRKE